VETCVRMRMRVSIATAVTVFALRQPASNEAIPPIGGVGQGIVLITKKTRGSAFAGRFQACSFLAQCSTTLGEWIDIQRPHEPGNNHLFENDRVGPDSALASEVPAGRIDPRLFRNVTGL